jgi:hypothetical protein
MNEIFKQSFNFAKIKIYKNYSNLGNKCVVYDSDPAGSGLPVNGVIPNDDPFGELTAEFPKKFTVSANINDTSCQSLFNVNLYQKNNRNFFYTTTPTDSYVNHAKEGHPTIPCEVVKLVNNKPLVSGGFNPDFYETTSDKHIRRHYNNPFAELEITKIERWIKEEDGKVKLKHFRQTKTRALNSRYFKKSTSATTITFNMKTGNFLIVTYSSVRKKTRKHFYCNSFLSLEQAIPTIFKVNEHNISKLSPLHKEFAKVFVDDDFNSYVFGILGLGTPISEWGTSQSVIGKNFSRKWMPRFAELKKIKLPNNGDRLLRVFYPTEKFLKKNDRKLVAAVLDRFGILSKLTVKILHENPNMELRLLVRMCQLFGDNYTKYLGTVSNDFFGAASPDFGDEQGSRHILMENLVQAELDVTDKEKENMVHIINDISAATQSHRTRIIEEFYDHFKMLKRLRFYYPELRLNVRKWDTFTNEHSRISAMERNIKKGYSTHNIFEKHILEAIEKPIEIISYPGTFKTKDFEELGNFEAQRDVYTPVLLRTSEQYVDEGAVMHHCVAGYIEHKYSIIVSLRHGTERVTCEFNTNNKDCRQSRAHQNQDPPKHFQKPLEMLKKQIKKIPFSIEPVDRRMIPLKINGIEVTPAEKEELFAPDLF